MYLGLFRIRNSKIDSTFGKESGFEQGCHNIYIKIYFMNIVVVVSDFENQIIYNPQVKIVKIVVSYSIPPLYDTFILKIIFIS